MDGRYEYYVLKSEKGKEFRIRKKSNNKYGFKDKEGDEVVCMLNVINCLVDAIVKSQVSVSCK
jgi:hypothetical protein